MSDLIVILGATSVMALLFGAIGTAAVRQYRCSAALVVAAYCVLAALFIYMWSPL